MKIKQIMIHNFAAVNEIEVNLKDDITYLVGVNSSGKSTIGISSIWFCLLGLAKVGKDVLHADRFRFIGEYGSNATVQLTLHDEKENIDIIVQRKLTKTKTELRIKASDDRELPDNFIDSIFNIFSINPVGFAKLTAKEQATTLGIDTTTYDALLKEKYEERKEINYEVKRLKGVLDEIGTVEPAKKIDTQKLLKKKDQFDKANTKAIEKVRAARDKAVQAAIKHNREQSDKQTKIAEMVREVERIEGNIKVVRDTYDEAKMVFEQAKREFKQDSEGQAAFHAKAIKRRDELPVPDEHLSTEIEIEQPEQEDTSALAEQIEQAATTNAASTKYQEFLRATEAHADIVAKQLNKNAEMQQTTNDRIQYVKSCKLPFDNINIDETGGMLINGRPFNETYFSRGEILRMGIKLISTTDPVLKYIFVPDARNIDDENREKLFTELVEAGFQVVAEMVDTKKQKDHTTILLKESKVVDNYEPVEEKIL